MANNKTTVKKIIAAAERRGELGDLVWFPNMKLPTYMRSSPDEKEAAATFPHGWVPVISLAPDKKEAKEKAHFLWEILVAANEGRGILFETLISSKSYMQEVGIAFYEWGQPITAIVDWVCPQCGAISRLVAGEKGGCCTVPYRIPRSRPPLAYPLPVNAGLVGKNWWGGDEDEYDVVTTRENHG